MGGAFPGLASQVVDGHRPRTGGSNGDKANKWDFLATCSYDSQSIINTQENQNRTLIQELKGSS